MYKLNDKVVYKKSMGATQLGDQGIVYRVSGKYNYYIVSFACGLVKCDPIDIDLVAFEIGDEVKIIGPVNGVHENKCLGQEGTIKSLSSTGNYATVNVILVSGYYCRGLIVNLSSLEKIGSEPKTNGTKWWT